METNATEKKTPLMGKKGKHKLLLVRKQHEQEMVVELSGNRKNY